MRASRLSLPRIIAMAILLGIAMQLSPSVSKRVSAKTADGNPKFVRIGVFGLFHPAHLTITGIPGQALLLQVAREQIVLESTSGKMAAKLQLSGADILVSAGDRVFRSPDVLVTGRNGEAVSFQLALPGKITRLYYGTLELRPSSGELRPIVAMDLETAVGSVVAAESTSDFPIEAIKAQAIAARSYLVSGRGRHVEFDFCDTTHCQFLRDPAKAGTAVSHAVDATRGLLLAYNSRPFTAMYTRSCGGHTRTPAQLGLSSNGYPYYEVECKYCLSRPAHWSSSISPRDAASLHPSDEASRLQVTRRLGWNTVPSNDFTSTTSGNEVLLRGTGYGHGIGLCQAGAKAMAESGATVREILTYYYPNTSIVEWTQGN